VERKVREARDIEAWAAELRDGRLPEALRRSCRCCSTSRRRTPSVKRSPRRASRAGRVRSSCSRPPARFPPRTTTTSGGSSSMLSQGLGCADAGTLPDFPSSPSRRCARSRSTTTRHRDRRRVLGARPRQRQTSRSASTSRRRRSRSRATARSTHRARAAVDVYMPGRKITMLPDAAIDAFTLAAGARPALSLYVETTHAGVPVRTRRASTRCPLRPTCASTSREAFANDCRRPATRRDRRAARALEARLAPRAGAWQARHRARRLQLYVDWDDASAGPEPGRVAIVPRPRGSPIDKLVAELMIFVNNTGGGCSPTTCRGLYRTQSMAR